MNEYMLVCIHMWHMCEIYLCMVYVSVCKYIAEPWILYVCLCVLLCISVYMDMRLASINIIMIIHAFVCGIGVVV